MNSCWCEGRKRGSYGLFQGLFCDPGNSLALRLYLDLKITLMRIRFISFLGFEKSCGGGWKRKIVAISRGSIVTLVIRVTLPLHHELKHHTHEDPIHLLLGPWKLLVRGESVGVVVFSSSIVTQVVLSSSSVP